MPSDERTQEQGGAANPRGTGGTEERAGTGAGGAARPTGNPDPIEAQGTDGKGSGGVGADGGGYGPVPGSEGEG